MKTVMIYWLWVAGLSFVTTMSVAQDNQLMKLPQPQIESGMPLMQALYARQSTREFSAEKLPAQVLSDLLWAAFGVNRPETGGRTAPSTAIGKISIFMWQPQTVFIYLMPRAMF